MLHFKVVSPVLQTAVTNLNGGGGMKMTLGQVQDAYEHERMIALGCFRPLNGNAELLKKLMHKAMLFPDGTRPAHQAGHELPKGDLVAQLLQGTQQTFADYTKLHHILNGIYVNRSQLSGKKKTLLAHVSNTLPACLTAFANNSITL